MSKNQINVDTEEDTMQDVYDEEITDEDYGFIFDKNGDLKSVFFPENYDVVPEGVRAIFQMYGIEDPESVIVHSVH